MRHSRLFQSNLVYINEKIEEKPEQEDDDPTDEQYDPIAFAFRSVMHRTLVEKWEGLGKNPSYWLYAIMRKESGFDPNTVSYADAMGLLQMIPPTTKRVAEAIGLAYVDGMLYDPETNIRVASWYIGRVHAKFRGQTPLAAGAFNAGPKPIMRWIDDHGARPMDELIELAAYTQTREYMKKVTGYYARYLYLYEGKVYEQRLDVDRAYVTDEVDY